MGALLAYEVSEELTSLTQQNDDKKGSDKELSAGGDPEAKACVLLFSVSFQVPSNPLL